MSIESIIAAASLSSPAASLVTQAFDPPILLKVFLFIPSFSVASVPRLRFNGDTGTTNYAYNVMDSNLIATVVTFTGLNGVAGAADGILLAKANSVNPVGAQLIIGNGPSQQHSFMFSGSQGAVDASAAPAVLQGSAIWANTARITSIQLDSPAGGNLGAGTGIMVIGISP